MAEITAPVPRQRPRIFRLGLTTAALLGACGLAACEEEPPEVIEQVQLTLGTSYIAGAKVSVTAASCTSDGPALVTTIV